MLIAGMICKNEFSRYLKEVVFNLLDFVDKLIILDDKSDDETYEWLKFIQTIDIKAKKKIILYQMPKSVFRTDEYLIRTTLWQKIKNISKNGDWILINDADEIIEQKYHNKILNLISSNNKFTSVGMRLYNMWSETEYRDDGAWSPKVDIKRRLFKFKPKDTWLYDRKFACGEVPRYVFQENLFISDIRLKHLAYMKEVDRIRKHKIYMEIDGGKFHAKYHLESIIQNPILKKY